MICEYAVLLKHSIYAVITIVIEIFKVLVIFVMTGLLYHVFSKFLRRVNIWCEIKLIEVFCQLAKPACAENLRQLAENLDQFDFAPGVHTPEEYGRYMIQKSGHFEYDENLEEFYNYGDYGVKRMIQEDGVFADRGYVSYHGTLTLDELMRSDPAENYQQEQEAKMEGMAW